MVETKKEPKEIDVSGDPQMVAYIDRLLGFHGMLRNLAEEKALFEFIKAKQKK